MTYLLDTNACICYLNGQSEAIMRRPQQIPPDEFAVCAVVKAELGMVHFMDRSPFQILPVIGRHFGGLRLHYRSASAKHGGTYLRQHTESVNMKYLYRSSRTCGINRRHGLPEGK